MSASRSLGGEAEMRKVWIVSEWTVAEGCTVLAIKLSEEAAKRYVKEDETRRTLKIQEFDWVDAYPRRRRSVYGLNKPRKPR